MQVDQPAASQQPQPQQGQQADQQPAGQPSAQPTQLSQSQPQPQLQLLPHGAQQPPLTPPRRQQQPQQQHFQQLAQQPLQQHTPPPAGGRGGNYSRKDKSLGLLCDNFLRTYEGQAPGASEVCLDEAANRLQVERRRIYDIVNVLESVEVVTRRQKNSYIWNGLDSLQNALQRLAHTAAPARAHSTASPSQSGTAEAGALSPAPNGLAPGETWGSFAASGFQMQQGGASAGTPEGGRQSSGGSMLGAAGFGTPGSVAASEDGGASDGGCARYTRKDKSLGLLSQRFIQLFLTSRTPVIALDDAALALRAPNEPEHEALDPAKLKTKVRRLYDIANVLSSLRLLDKTQLPDSRKPAFRWRGCPAPGEVSAALAAGAGAARTPNDHLRALIDGAASEASQGADTGSPASASGGKRGPVGMEQTNGHPGKRSRAGAAASNAMNRSRAGLPPCGGGSGSYSPPETPAPGAGDAHMAAAPSGDKPMTPSPSAPGNTSDLQRHGNLPAADSQTGPQPLAAPGHQTPPPPQPHQQQLQQAAAVAPQLQASPVPPGFIAGTMPGMPFPGMLPMPPMLPPGVAGGAGMPSFVPPPFAAGMAGMPPMMQQMPGISGAMAAAGSQQQQLPLASGAPSGDTTVLHQQMMASAMQFWQYWAAFNQQQQQQQQQQQGAAQAALAHQTAQTLQQQHAPMPPPQQQAPPQTVQQAYQPSSHQPPLQQAPAAGAPPHQQYAASAAMPVPGGQLQAQPAPLPVSATPSDVVMADTDAAYTAQPLQGVTAAPHQMENLHLSYSGGGSGGGNASGGGGGHANGGAGHPTNNAAVAAVLPAMAGVSVAAPALSGKSLALGGRTNSGVLAVARTIAAQRSSSGSGSPEPHQLPPGVLPLPAGDHVNSSEAQSYPPPKLRHSSSGGRQHF